MLENRASDISGTADGLCLGHEVQVSPQALSYLKKQVETSKVRGGLNFTPLLFIGCMADGVLSERGHCEINLEFLFQPPIEKWPLGPKLCDYRHDYG